MPPFMSSIPWRSFALQAGSVRDGALSEFDAAPNERLVPVQSSAEDLPDILPSYSVSRDAPVVPTSHLLHRNSVFMVNPSNTYIHLLPHLPLVVPPALSLEAMCRLEVFGDWYRGCGHFVKAYYSGEKTDCYSGTCPLSVNHIHKAPECPCPKVEHPDERRIINMFQTTCDTCRGVDFPLRR